MNITGDLSRTIYNKSGDNFVVDATFVLHSTSGGALDFSFSGDSVFNLRFGSGMIFDTNNRFIESYQKNIPVNIKLHFDSPYCDIYVDNNPVELQLNVGEYNYQYVNITTSGPTGTIDLNISGTLPNISIPETGIMDDNGFVYIPVTVLDSGKVLEVYNLVLDRQNDVRPFCFDPFITGSGNFQFYGNPLITGTFEQEFDIYTNGGVIETGITIYRQTGITGGYLNMFPRDNFSIIVDNNIHGPVTGNYIISTFNLSQYPYFDVRLEYVSGSGLSSFYVTGSGSNGTGYVSGTITGSGYLTGTSIVGTLSYNSGVSGTVAPYTGYGYGFHYITGTFVKNFVTEIIGSGLYSGVLVRSTGLYTGTITGTILEVNSGVYTYSNVNISGIPHRPYFASGEVSGSGFFTGVINGSITGSGFVTKSGNNLTLLGTVLHTGVKTFLNTWKLRTGIFTNSLVDFHTQGWHSSNEYSDEGFEADVPYSAGHYRIYAQLEYNNPYQDRPIDVVNLHFSNGIQSGFLNITGTYTGNV